jgi:DNA-binding CsgD family transcriptional regulator
MAYMAMDYAPADAGERGRGGLQVRLLHEIVRATGSVWARATLELGPGFIPLADNAFGLEGAEEAWAADPWRTRRPRAREQIFRCETYLRPEAWRQSALFTDILEPGGIDPTWTLIGSAACDDGDLVLMVSRPEAAGPYSADDIARAESHLRLLAQAVELEQRAARAGATLTLAEQVLDSVTVALLVTDASGRVKVSNRAATGLLESADWVTIDQGRLTASDPDQDTRLQKLLHLACRNPSPGAALLRIRGQAGWCTATVSPLRSPLVSGALVALSTAGEQDQRLDRLQALFGLTHAEGRLAGALLNGESVSEHATTRGISINTARVQLGSALKKTGARRQAELVALLASIPPVRLD